MVSRRDIADRQRRQPVIQHRTRPDLCPPFLGCHCDACEDAREDAHGEQVGEILGLTEDTTTETDEVRSQRLIREGRY